MATTAAALGPPPAEMVYRAADSRNLRSPRRIFDSGDIDEHNGAIVAGSEGVGGRQGHVLGATAVHRIAVVLSTWPSVNH